ncbi:TetR/AcrR family transcriptional regulator [Vagococcus coleopterorum]|uniref:TetR/AcrR family transcriptional regulator n=1 Tax=Vagococcus coleopterorum TaxID=2714946 RepID=A0A6G8AL70_9ENTE|nr:TetR/AcrR family transcriptional regulator [Vagococcus coleopterorum]QIL45675.1 TetR/AcrR family transcriptional regulator [Vagococcus coleopterorum]
MARRKTITRDQILSATYEIVRTEGFSGFTARNIAFRMNCSTQPIYLEFKNMDELKGEVCKQIKSYLDKKIFMPKLTNHPFLDAQLNYIHLAVEEPVLFRTLFLENHQGKEWIRAYSSKYFMELINQDPNYSDQTDEMKEIICTQVWIASTGIGSLRAGQMIHPDDEAIREFLQRITENAKSHKLDALFVS